MAQASLTNPPQVSIPHRQSINGECIYQRLLRWLSFNTSQVVYQLFLVRPVRSRRSPRFNTSQVVYQPVYYDDIRLLFSFVSIPHRQSINPREFAQLGAHTPVSIPHRQSINSTQMGHHGGISGRFNTSQVVYQRWHSLSGQRRPYRFNTSQVVYQLNPRNLNLNFQLRFNTSQVVYQRWHSLSGQRRPYRFNTSQVVYQLLPQLRHPDGEPCFNTSQVVYQRFRAQEPEFEKDDEFQYLIGSLSTTTTC